ncbi:putative disease resistance protein [Senna tora]|uniref:Putative disease resistance protein n=1 Tax=Senna tora TaxID=362788 RepID=A0A835CGV6_9FABA|nr:putative disease resistance protein [Senna tora]
MAAEFGTNIATKVAETCIDKAMKEAGYLCCFKSYVEDYEKEHSRLLATRESLQNDIKEARQRNETEIDDETQQWLKEANDLINIDTKEKKKWFGFLTNCIWQYKRGKVLAGKRLDIPKVMERRNNLRIARSIGAPGMEYHSSPDFIYFESRKAKFEQLKKALKNSNNHLVGLQGMGGTGKTTMATQVGKEFEESKLFDKVIFTVVSNPPNVEKIRSDIAKHLVSQPEDAKNLKDSNSLWFRITNGGEKILIILDDVWQELNLKAIGIPLGFHQKGHSSVLLTTRSMTVCKKMNCQDTINLGLLSKEDALNLFLLHAGVNVDSSCSDMRNMASNIVKECGRLPVAIVPIAKTLKSESLKDWEAALIRLKNVDPTLDDIDEDLIEVYKSLRLSYDNLKNEKAKELFLLCSLFPEDFELPTEDLSKIAIGLGLCGNANNYYIARSHVLGIMHKLIDSSLLLKADEDESVKMHDLVREVAQWIGKEEIQVIMDSKTNLKENIRYSFWNIDCIANHFDGKKLEFLWVKINAEVSVELLTELFKDIKRLRVLILIAATDRFWKTLTLSLPLSFQSLRNIRTLILERWKLGDISIMGSLKSLETLELTYCWITKLPEEIEALEKLRLLGLKRCEIERDNPFKVIERIPKLEELYYVNNYGLYLDKIIEGEEIHQIGTFRAWKRYQIIQGNRFFPDDSSVSKRFSPGKLIKIFSEATIKDLAARAEILVLGGCQKTGRTNLIPDIVPMENGGMIMLFLYDWPEIECVIHTKNLQSGVPIFSKLVFLALKDMDVKELCCGTLPTDFLKELKMLCLYECMKLEGTLLKGKLDLGKLKSIILNNCSMSSLFHPSTARSLKQLKKLEIIECKQLKYIITNEGGEEEKVDVDDDNIFHSLEVIDIFDVPNFINTLSWAPLYCCFQPTLPNSSSSQASKTALVLDRVQCLFRPPLNPHNMRNMTITHCSNITSLFTFSLASSISRSLPQLEIISVSNCDDLVQIIEETEQDPDLSHQERFPKLTRIHVIKCIRLKCLFSISTCGVLPNLMELKIEDASELKQVFGCNQGEKKEMSTKDVFPKLETLVLQNLPSLECVCQGFDFQIVPTRFVHHCPKISLTSTTKISDDENDQDEEGPEDQYNHVQSKSSEEAASQSKKEAIEGVIDEDLHNNNTSNFTESKKTTANEAFKQVLTSDVPAMSASSSNSIPQQKPSLEVHEKKPRGDREALDESLSTKEPPGRVDRPANEVSSKEGSEKTTFEDTSPLISSVSTSKKPQRKKEATTEVVDEDLEIQEQNNNTSNLTESNKAAPNEVIEQVPCSDIPAMAASSSNPDMSREIPQQTSLLNIEVSGGEGPSSENYIKPTSSTHSAHPGPPISTQELREKKPRGDREALEESISTNEAPGRVYKPANEISTIEGSNKNAWISRISSSKKPQAVTAPTDIEPGGSKSNNEDNSCNIEYLQETEIDIDEEIKVEHTKPEQSEEDDLTRLFRIMEEEDTDMGVGMPYVSNIAAGEDDNKVARAFANLEASLKMGLNEIANSEEDIIRLQNALNFLSSHCSEEEDGAPSHGLSATIDSLHQEIQSIISSFKQASSTIDTFTKLEGKEKHVIIEELPQRKKAANTLNSEIDKTEKSMAELKEQILRLQAELNRKEKEFKECEIKLSCLQEKKKKSVWDNMGFMKEFVDVKKDRSHMEQEQIKARQELENSKIKWSSCVANLKKTTMLLGIYLKQKI